MTGNQAAVGVPPHVRRVKPWRQSVRGGSAADRTLSEVVTSVPPYIAGLSLTVPSQLGAQMDDALREIAALDESHGAHLGSLSTLVLRAESVASSKIENVEASMDDFARALHGSRSNSSAVSMVASTEALQTLIDSVHDGSPVTVERVLSAHSRLMEDDPGERSYAGRIRDMQNWVGGSDHSPRGALYVPPPPDTVVELLRDVLDFANRDDLNVLVQASIAHAQFESIHPFTDGNGRIGRALINTVLRRRGATRRVVVPLASALVAEKEAYFATLGDYRNGDAAPIISSFATAARIASAESRATADRLARLPEEWRDLAGRPRRGSAADRILGILLDHPVLSADDAHERLGGATSSVYAGIERLHETGVLRPLTQRVRNQVWVAGAIADELDDLGVRIASAASRAKSRSA